MNTARILALVSSHVEPQLRHLVTVDAAFEELRLAMDHAWSIASDWEVENGREMDWRQVEKWQTVADIIATVRNALAGTDARIGEMRSSSIGAADDGPISSELLLQGHPS